MATQLSRIVGIVREERDEFILLTFIGLIALLVFVETRGLLPRTRQVPVLIAALMALVLVATVLLKLFGQSLLESSGWGGGTGILDVERDDRSEDTEHLFDLNSRQVLKHFVWLVGYLVSLVFVGFWTTNVVFPFAYIMRYETSPLRRRFLYFLLTATFINVTLWLLFVELLNVQSIWRLGPLP